MPRIYFDTNVFSNLRANKLPLYQKLNQLIAERKERLSLYFSMGHIRDKRKDLTDFKFLDFEFMESLTGDNYLAYDPIKLRPSLYLATPKMVFDEDSPEEEYASIMNAFEPSEDDDELTASIKSMTKSMFTSIPMDIDNGIFEDLPQEQKKLVSSFIPMEKGATFMDVIDNMMRFTEDLHKDGLFYKDLRTMVDKGMNDGQITLNGEEDFNEALKDTAIQKTFFDFIKDSIYHKDKDKIPYYDFFQLAYNMLDVLGISKDKITKKNTLGNLQNDGFHSYFAGYCDYFVTDDKSTIVKAKAMYGLFRVSTKVISVEEFIEILPEIISAEMDDWSFMMKKLLWDLQHGERKHSETIDGVTMARLARNHRYLDFFDSVVDVSSPDFRKMIAFKGEAHALSEPSFSECKKIIHQTLLILGPDDEHKLEFDYHKLKSNENEQLIRRWKLSDQVLVELNSHPEINGKYGLAFIFPLQKSVHLGRWKRFWTAFKRIGFLKKIRTKKG